MTATIFLDMKKDCEKVDREKTFEELENLGIQGRSLDFRELFCERWIKVRVSGSILQSTNTDLGIPQGGIFKSTVGTNKLDTWTAKRGLTFYHNKTVSIIFGEEREMK